MDRRELEIERKKERKTEIGEGVNIEDRSYHQINPHYSARAQGGLSFDSPICIRLCVKDCFRVSIDLGEECDALRTTPQGHYHRYGQEKEMPRYIYIYNELIGDEEGTRKKRYDYNDYSDEESGLSTN